MSRLKLSALAVVGVALAITLGSWLGTPPQSVVARQALEYGTSLGGNSGFDESPWFLEGGDRSEGAVPEKAAPPATIPDDSVEGLPFY